MSIKTLNQFSENYLFRFFLNNFVSVSVKELPKIKEIIDNAYNEAVKNNKIKADAFEKGLNAKNI